MGTPDARPTGAEDRVLTRQDALARAEAMVPALKARAEQCAAERRVPDETIREMRANGLLRLLQPARHGGSEQGWDVFCEVIQILGAACGSQAWVYRVLGDHAKMIGTFPAEAQEEVWGRDHDALASSSFAPVGRARPVAGGYLLSGRYTFSSGIDHADWVICGGIIEDAAGGPAGPHYFLVPKSAVTVIDDWYVSGLEGSGSKSFAIDGALVPPHRLLEWQAASLGRGPGIAINTAPIFRLPRGGYTTSAFAALMVGMARGMFAGWLDLNAKRRSEGRPVAALESMQMVAGAVAADLAAAEGLYLTMIRDSMRMVEAGVTMPPERAIAARAQVAQACQIALGAGHRMRDAMGSAAIYRNPMERQYRNLLAGAQHVAINWPKASAALGALLLRQHGADLVPPGVPG